MRPAFPPCACVRVSRTVQFRPHCFDNLRRDKVSAVARIRRAPGRRDFEASGLYGRTLAVKRPSSFSLLLLLLLFDCAVFPSGFMVISRRHTIPARPLYEAVLPNAYTNAHNHFMAAEKPRSRAARPGKCRWWSGARQRRRASFPRRRNNNNNHPRERASLLFR